MRRRLDDPPAEITVSLFTGYLAYLPAEAAGVSAVLAAVTVGLYMGWYTPELTTAEMRLRGVAVWELLLFVAQRDAVRLHRPAAAEPIMEDLEGIATADLVGYAAAGQRGGHRRALPVGVPGAYLIRLVDRRPPRHAPGRGSGRR